MDIVSFFQEHGFELESQEVEKFSKFLELFEAYNSHTNLSAIREKEGIVEKHFIDSLYGAQVIAPLLEEKGTLRLLDIGSGGGFPGIPLKIILDALDITLLDSVGKKVKAMNHFIEGIGLSRIQALQERAEVLAKDPSHKGSYDIITSRATAYITDILTWAVPFLKKNGKIILYKMPSQEERKDQIKVLAKLGLVLNAEFEYELAGKTRLISIFSKK